MKYAYKILIALLLFAIGVYDFNISIVMTLLIFYLIGNLFCRLLFNYRERVVTNIYDLFFFVYLLLVFCTEVELINNPYIDYFVHYDASHNFFAPFMETARRVTWKNIIQETFMDYQYGDRPLTAFISVVMIKCGQYLGVEDFRLMLRASVALHAALIPASIASIMSIYGFKAAKIIKYVVPFGLISYLFITSGVFTRDTHICFFYTMAAYVFLLPKCKLRWVWFAIIFILTFGHRYENGIIVLIYALGAFYANYKNRFGWLIYITMILLIFIIAYEMRDTFMVIEDTLSRYDERAQGNVGGLFQRFYSLPFPLNTISMVVYLLLMPLPLSKYIIEDGGSWLTLPYILSPYLMSMLFIITVMYCIKNINKMDREVVLIFICITIFTAITYGSPDIRRSFASVPGLYMAYCLISPRIARYKYKNIKKVVWPIILIIQVFFIIYTLK